MIELESSGHGAPGEVHCKVWTHGGTVLGGVSGYAADPFFEFHGPFSFFDSFHGPLFASW